jgi:hypothetical protein
VVLRPVAASVVAAAPVPHPVPVMLSPALSMAG